MGCNFSDLLTFIGVGLLGGIAGHKLKIPSGALMGSMISVIAFKILSERGWTAPTEYRFLVQVLLGVMIGATFERRMIGVLGKLVAPILCSTLVLVATGLVLSIVFTKLGLMNVTTSYLGTNPGAISVLAFLAVENNADPTVVLTFHFVRVAFVLLTAPWVVRFLSGWT